MLLEKLVDAVVLFLNVTGAHVASAAVQRKVPKVTLCALVADDIKFVDALHAFKQVLVGRYQEIIFCFWKKCSMEAGAVNDIVIFVEWKCLLCDLGTVRYIDTF